MITRVYDAAGKLLHDCKEAGCTTSWDGYTIPGGEPVENRADPDPETWDVHGDTAQHRGTEQ